MCLLAWTLFAFGAVYPWSMMPALAAVLLIAALQRPVILSGDGRWLDLALILVLAAAALQLIPLPVSLRDAISPSAADYRQRISLLGVPIPDRASLSLAPSQWLWGPGVLVATTATFWTAREAARSHGARLLARWIAWMGLAAGALAIVSPALFHTMLIYGFWKPQAPNPHPAGPFVSNNHFASWLVLAIPLTAGYLAAHARTHWARRSKRVQMLADTRAFWLVGAGALMTAALFVTKSRGGTLGFAAAVTFGLVRAWRRLGAGGRVALLGYAAVLLAAAALWAKPELVVGRFEAALGADAWGGRPMIWQETIRLIARFWLVGVGLGSFEAVMAVYQTATHAVFFNHAHNQYLHVLAEGGLLVTIPAALTVAAFFALTFRRLAEDRSPSAHLREGALAGIVGLAVQSIWETPLLTPAVALLLAVSAALAVHPATHASDVEGSSEAVG